MMNTSTVVVIRLQQSAERVYTPLSACNDVVHTLSKSDG